MRDVIVSVLTFVGAWSLLLLVGVVLLAKSCQGDNDYRVLATVPSPDGAYIATHYSGMGGGAAGWCAQFLAVNRSSRPFDLAKDASAHRKPIFSCDAQVKLQWLADKVLQVEVQPGDARDLSLSIDRAQPLDEVELKYAFASK